MNPKIVIVEDEMIEALHFKQSLTSFGYQVLSIASTGEESIKLAAELKPDLILMDIILKGEMDGIEAAARIKDEYNIPVVYLTAHPEENTVNRAKTTNPYGYLIKPVNKTDLKNTIDLALYKHRLELSSQERQILYHSLYSSMHEGVAIHKIIYEGKNAVDYEIIDINPSFENILGFTRGEIIGERASAAYNTEKAPYLEEYAEVAETGNSMQFETYFEPLKKYFSISVFSPATGMFATIFEDITERKEVQKQIEKQNYILKSIIESTEGAIFSVDRDYRYTSFNNAHANYMKSLYNEDIEIGENILDYMTVVGDRENAKINIDKSLEGLQLKTKTHSGHEEFKRLYFEISHNPIQDKSGKAIGVAVYAHDITDSHVMTHLLINERNKLKNILDSMLDGVYIVNEKFEIEYVNPAMEKEFGYINNEKCYEYLHNREDKCPWCKNEEVFQGKTVTWEWTSEETGKTFELFDVPLKNPDETISKLEIFHDITPRIKAEEELKKSEERLKLTLEAVNEGVWDWNIPTGEAIFSPSYYKMLGYEPYEFPQNYKTWKSLVHPDDIVRVEKEINKHIQSGDGYSAELRMKTKPGNWLWIMTRGKVVERDSTGTPIRMVGTHTDIGQQKSAENTLKKSLDEKEVLLKEIHHRVKNNLQIISSLLDLQEDYVKEDPTAVNVLQESQNRVLSMAIIHEMLYQSKDLSHINLADYIRNLTSNLFDSYGMGNGVSSSINVEDVFLNIETAVPCGLIISELISNSLKYAFPKRIGEVKVTLKAIDHHFKLNISDDGIGLPKDLDFKKADSSLGFRLVNSLVNQLDGNIDLDRTQGTKFTIIFEELKYKDRM